MGDNNNELTTEDFRNALEQIEAGNHIEFTNVGGGILRIDLNVDDLTSDFDKKIDLPIAVGGEVHGLRTDIPYFVPYGIDLLKLSDPNKAPLWSCHIDAIATSNKDDWNIAQVAIVGPDGTEAVSGTTTMLGGSVDEVESAPTFESFGLYPEKLVAFWNEKEQAFVTFADLMTGLIFLKATTDMAKDLAAKKADAGPLMLRTGKQFTEAMRATTKRGTFDRESGGEFIMSGDLMISTEKKGELAVNVGMSKILVVLNALATASGYKYGSGANCVVTTSVAEILSLRGLPDTRKNREAVRRDARKLAEHAWTWENERGDWIRVPLSGGTTIVGRGGDGEITFTISADFMGAVLNMRAGLMPENPLLLRTDDKRNPLAFVLGIKLTTHTFQNYGKQNQNTLSVAKLLEYVQDFLPTVADLKASRASATQKIVAPVERDLHYLVDLGVLRWWDYCHAKGEPLSDDEQAERIDKDGKEKPLPYDVAIKANIQWQLAEEYAEQMAGTVEARGRKREESLRRKEERASRERRIQSRVDSRVAKSLADRKLAEIDAESAPSKSQEAR